MTLFRVAPSVATIEEVLLTGRLRPAAVQRSYRWTADDALHLLRDLDDATAEPLDDGDAADAGGLVDADEDGFIDDGEGEEGQADFPPPALGGPRDPRAVEDAQILPLDDDARATERLFYLGTMVMHRGRDGVYEIYDGLQRIVTVTILAAVLRDLEDDRELRAPLQRMIQSPDGQYRLSLREHDQTLERDVQSPGGTLRNRDGEGRFRVVGGRPIGLRVNRVKVALQRALVGWTPERRRAVAETLRRRAFVAVLDADDAELARQIFVSTNLYGRALEPLEVLRGQVAAAARSADEEDALMNAWDAIGAAVDDETFLKPWYWDRAVRLEPGEPDPAEKPTPRASFLKAFDMLERSEPQTARWAADLGEHVQQVCRDDGPGAFTRRLRRAADGWFGVQRAISAPGGSAVKREVWRLSLLPWDDWTPLAIVLWNRFRGARGGEEGDRVRREARKAFARLSERCMVLAAADLRPSNRARLFARAVRTAVAGGDPTLSRGAKRFTEIVQRVPDAGTIFPNFDQRRKADRTLRGQIKDPKMWRALTMWLEAAADEGAPPTKIRAGSVEHILPRQPKSETRARFEAAAESYDALCFSLGNLAMVGWQANERAENADPERKRQMLEQEGETFALARDAAAQQVLDGAALRARSERMRQAFWSSITGVSPPA